jgi:reductive dehalogenase
MSDEKAGRPGLNRRDFLRYGGAAAAVASVAGSAAAGLAIGGSSQAYGPWGGAYTESAQFFDREPFRVDVAPFMTPVAEVERPDWADMLIYRMGAMAGLLQSGRWDPSTGVEGLPVEALRDYYTRKGSLEQFFAVLEASRKREEDWARGKHMRYAIADAYGRSYHETGLVNRYGSTVEEPQELCDQRGTPVPPEEWDYRHIWRKEPLEFKSPAHATKLIKHMAHLYGAPLVGITKFDPRFMYKNVMRGMPNMGFDSWGEKVPAHWKSVIVFAVPMNWDPLYAAKAYSTSYDGYFRVRNVAGLLERFLNELGHPARAEFTPSHYELMMGAYMILAGLGEFSRAGIVMAPEFGLNCRPSAVITDIEFEYDRPISVGMAGFCKKCKICAETCPAGCIPFDDEPQTVVRGFRRWRLSSEERCLEQWANSTTQDQNGCRICVAVCPFTRKNTWIHTISRELEPRDPTGLVGSGLLAMQRNFFSYPKAEEFNADWNGGREATFHNPPWWERAEDFFVGVNKTWDYRGME